MSATFFYKIKVNTEDKEAMNMDFETLAKDGRWSCRSYQDKPLAKEDLDKILEAGRVAPTAANAQPQRIIAVTTKEGMEKLAQCTHYTYKAPAAFIVCYDSSEVWVRNYDGKNSGDVDASIVTTHMMLQAADLGVGTCWVGHFNPWTIKELFHIPENVVPVAILDAGYPTDTAKPHQIHFKRRPLNETVVMESF